MQTRLHGRPWLTQGNPFDCADATEEAAMAGLYYEEFFVGQEFEHPWTRTVTEMDNVLFSSLTMNVQPLHLDANFAAGTEFGRPLVNSIFTLGLIIGISVNDTTIGTTVGNLGFSETKFPKPVFHGDTLRARTKVLTMRESRSRPEVGIVEFEHTGWNQRNEMVALCRRQAMMRKRPTA
ncbi:MAG TPA: MaoC family dehydratase [Rhodopila sp.]|nr:MaoC family dehydratase [Rhodopila sp.]HVY13858.1 MaoC family dehydratase [Rhodopila sp.]